MARVTVGFDFLRDDLRAAAPVSVAEAEELVAGYYGLAARARPLGSQQDTNFLLVGPDDVPLGVLKIANTAFGAEEVEAQDAAAALLADACPDLRFATALPRPDRRVPTLLSPDGPRLARVLRYLPGGTFTGPGYLAPDVVAGFGRVAGRLSVALAAFTHPGLDRVLQWDLRHADEVLRRLAGALLDRHKLGRVLDAGRAAWAQVGEVADALPRQAVHLDLTDDNVVRTGRAPDGVIDFGDLTTTWAVAEPAITISSVLHHAGARAVLGAARGAGVPRRASAVGRRGRGAVAAGGPARRRDRREWALPGRDRRVQRLRRRRARARVADVRAGDVRADRRDDGADPGRGRQACAGAVRRSPASSLVAEPVARLDLSVDSDAVDNGAWLAPDLADRLAARYDGTVATAYGRARLAGSPPLAMTSPATVPTGVDLWTDAALRAPWAGRVAEASDGRVVLAAEGWAMTVAGPVHPLVPVGATVAPGAPLARPLPARSTEALGGPQPARLLSGGAPDVPGGAEPGPRPAHSLSAGPPDASGGAPHWAATRRRARCRRTPRCRRGGRVGARGGEGARACQRAARGGP